MFLESGGVEEHSMVVVRIKRDRIIIAQHSDPKMIEITKSFAAAERQNPNGWTFHVLRPVYATANVPAGWNG